MYTVLINMQISFHFFYTKKFVARAVNLNQVSRKTDLPVLHEAEDLLGQQRLILLVPLWRKEVECNCEDSLLLAFFTLYSKCLLHIHFVQHLQKKKE